MELRRFASIRPFRLEAWTHPMRTGTKEKVARVGLVPKSQECIPSGGYCEESESDRQTREKPT